MYVHVHLYIVQIYNTSFYIVYLTFISKIVLKETFLKFTIWAITDLLSVSSNILCPTYTICHDFL